MQGITEEQKQLDGFALIRRYGNNNDNNYYNYYHRKIYFRFTLGIVGYFVEACLYILAVSISFVRDMLDIQSHEP